MTETSEKLKLIDECIKDITSRTLCGDQEDAVNNCRRRAGDDNLVYKVLMSIYTITVPQLKKNLNFIKMLKSFGIIMPDYFEESCTPVYANNLIFESENLNHTIHLKNHIKASIPQEHTSSEAKIPKILHYVWVTNSNSPETIKKLFLKHNKYLESNLEKTPSSEGWKHYLWTNNIATLPDSIKQNLSDLSVDIKDISELVGFKIGKIKSDTLIDLACTCTYSKLFGMATDIIRYLATFKFGGFYMDGDYLLYRNIDDMLDYTSVFAIGDPYDMYIANGFFGVTPAHPVIENVIRLVQRNTFHKLISPDYIKFPCDFSQQTLSISGPVAISIAYANISKQGLLQDDMILPYGIALRHEREEKDIEENLAISKGYLECYESKAEQVGDFIQNYAIKPIGNDDFSSSWIED